MRAIAGALLLIVGASLAAAAPTKPSIFRLPFDSTPGAPVQGAALVAQDPLDTTTPPLNDTEAAALAAAEFAAVSSAAPADESPAEIEAFPTMELIAALKGFKIRYAKSLLALDRVPARCSADDGDSCAAVTGSAAAAPTPTAEEDPVLNATRSKGRARAARKIKLRKGAAYPAVSTNKNVGGIIYHGGPLMTGVTTVYPIWYGTWTAVQKQLVRDLIQGLSNSEIQSVQATYGDSGAKYVRKALQLGAEYTYSTLVYTSGITDGNIQSLVSGSLGTLGRNADGIYLVLTGPEVKATSGFCTKYCGWHTYFSSSGVYIKFGFIGNAASLCKSSCGVQGSALNGAAGDAGVEAMSSVIAHEIWEAQSDPQLNAYYDSKGSENADKCAWNWGPASGQLPSSTSNPKYNVVLTYGATTRKFLLQTNWAATTTAPGCATTISSYTSPTVAFTSTTGALSLPGVGVNCPTYLTSALSSFGFKDTSTSMWYAFKCTPFEWNQVQGTTAPVAKATVKNAAGSGNTAYLDRHVVDCGATGAITAFTLASSGGATGQIWYNYACQPMVGTVTCTNYYTPAASTGGGYVKYLDLHNPSCPPGAYLSYVRLYTSATTTPALLPTTPKVAPGMQAYEYKCCRS